MTHDRAHNRILGAPDNRGDWILPPLREGAPAPDDILARRAEIAALGALHRNDPGVPRRRRHIAGVACHEVGGATDAPTVLYFHGGGYRLGDPVTWLGFLANIARDGALRFVVPDYRLAPEHPFPAALHDAASVYRELLADTPGGIVVAGDSAGGGLAAALTLAAERNGARSPDALILLSPWLDLTLASASYETHAARDRMFSRASAEQAASLYLQGHGPEDPLASPLLADLANFPPVQIFCGGDEVLLGDCLDFVARLGRANRTVEAHVVAGMQHVWPMIAPQLTESRAACAAMARFARRIARSDNPG